MRLVDAGFYDGKIVDYGISEAKSSGNPQAFVVFELIEPMCDNEPTSDPVKLTWFGSLATKASNEGGNPPIDFTVKVLLDCGFSGEAIENMAAGVASNCLEVGHEMSLTIEDHEWEGNYSSKIKWVNVKGQAGPGVKKMSQEQVSGKLNTSALRAALLREREKRTKGADVPKVPL